MKRKLFSLLLALLLTSALITLALAEPPPYDDPLLICCGVTHYAYMTGYGDGTIRPQANITRAEAATILFRTLQDVVRGINWTQQNGFSDVLISDWYNNAVSIGLIKGYEDGTYRPNEYITRAETMTLMNRFFERAPESPADLLPDMVTWTDNMDESAWYYLDVQEATNSHDYERKRDVIVPGQRFEYESWHSLIPNRDWSALEQEWSAGNEVYN